LLRCKEKRKPKRKNAAKGGVFREFETQMGEMKKLEDGKWGW